MNLGAAALRLVEQVSDRLGKGGIQVNHVRGDPVKHCHTETISGILTIPILQQFGRRGGRKGRKSEMAVHATGQQGSKVMQPQGTSCQIQCHLKGNPRGDNQASIVSILISPYYFSGKQL